MLKKIITFIAVPLCWLMNFFVSSSEEVVNKLRGVNFGVEEALPSETKIK